MLVKRAGKVCMCVTLAIATKLTIFIVGNPIICLLRNFTGYFGCTKATVSLDKNFLKPKIYATRAFKVCTCKLCVIFDYLLFTLCSSVSGEALLHAIAITVKPRFTGPLGGKELGPVNREARYIGVHFTLIYT